jgi:oligopeptide transport system permease protein
MAKTKVNSAVETTNDGLDDLFVFVDHNSFESEKITAPRYSYWKSVGRVFAKKKSNWIFIGMIVILLLLAFIWPLVHSYSLDTIGDNLLNNDTHNLTPGEAFNQFGFDIRWLFGTNKYGGSNWDAVWTGTRTSLLLALICTAINMTIGIVLGAVWGLSKKFDVFMTQVYNILGNVPFILLISVLMYILGRGFWSFIAALTITGWLGIAYFIRTQVIIIRDREYNLASRCLGTGIMTIVFKNILPFLISIIVTLLATELPSYISYEVFLSYVGIGLTANDTSLGRLINDTQSSWDIYPWAFWPPVIVSAIVSVVLYVLGQSIGDASDPRTHMA